MEPGEQIPFDFWLVRGASADLRVSVCDLEFKFKLRSLAPSLRLRPLFLKNISTSNLSLKSCGQPSC